MGRISKLMLDSRSIKYVVLLSSRGTVAVETSYRNILAPVLPIPCFSTYQQTPDKTNISLLGRPSTGRRDWSLLSLFSVCVYSVSTQTDELLGTRRTWRVGKKSDTLSIYLSVCVSVCYCPPSGHSSVQMLCPTVTTRGLWAAVQ